MDSVLKKYFEKYRILYVIHEHPPVFTVEESKKIKNNLPGMHCKTLFLKDDKSRYYLVGMPALKRLDISSLRREFGARKLHFGSEEELFSLLKLRPGSVSIFGMIHDKEHKVKLIIDSEIWDAEIVGFHPNINTATLEIKHSDLEKFYESIKSEKAVMKL